MLSRHSRTSLSFLFLLLIATVALAVSKRDLQNLPPHYRDWLQKDVAYIITEEETQAFVHLTTNAERDDFIERFWAIRNPDPGSPKNTYREEIYERIAYANQWFGHGSNMPGWMTDMGRVYITLGPPQQKGKYYGFANIRPMEIWFYSNGHPALPPFFSVVFYKPDTGADFKLYSPYMDGPEKLVTGATENDRLASWKQIDHDAGREVSRTILSLIPNEPVDTDTATSSLSSDVMIGNIRGLANHPLNKELLNTRRQLLEAVSHRVILPGNYLEVLTVPLVDDTGETNLHFVLRLKHAQDFSISEDSNHRFFYSAAVSVKVLTPEGKLIYAQDRKLSKFLSDKEVSVMKHRAFGYEGVLPLAPGKYKVEFLLSDEVKKTAFRDEQEVVIPRRPVEGYEITNVVPFSEATTNTPAYFPFTVAGVRFTPTYASGLTIGPGQDLQFFYQISAAAKPPTDGTLHVEYAYGRMGLHDTKQLADDVRMDQFSQHATLINGKKISTADLPIGNYRMAISVVDPGTHKRSVASFMFTVADTGLSPAPWDVPDPEVADDVKKGAFEYSRALSFLSQGDNDSAIKSFMAAFHKNPEEITRTHLVDILYSHQRFADVANLYAKLGITAQTNEDTALQMAESFQQLGQVNKSIQVIESVLPFRQSRTLYKTLSQYYQKAGNNVKAVEMEQKASSSTTSTPGL